MTNGRKRHWRWLVPAVFAFALFAFWFVVPSGSLSLESIRGELDHWRSYRAEHPLEAALGYVVIYVGLAASSIPAASPLTLLGGALFGVVWGTILVSVASTTGATLACLASRTVLRDWVEARFSRQMETIGRGIERDGWRYLMTLRLIPVSPFFVINLVMGLTRMRIITFMIVSQIGMLPATVLYVNAGARLETLHRASDVLSPSLWASLLLLAGFPFAIKWIGAWFQSDKPKRAD